jgi:hypothetical protein
MTKCPLKIDDCAATKGSPPTTPSKRLCRASPQEDAEQIIRVILVFLS